MDELGFCLKLQFSLMCSDHDGKREEVVGWEETCLK
jgi:hypothetical protein